MSSIDTPSSVSVGYPPGPINEMTVLAGQRRDIEILKRKAPDPTGGEPGEWQTPTLLNSFSQAGDPYEDCQFRLGGGPFSLEFKGHLNVEAATSGTVAFTLPSGWRLADLGHEDQFFDSLVRIEETGAMVDAIVYIEATSGDVIVIWGEAALGGGGYASAADLLAHLTDPSAAHAASAVSVADSGGYYTGTDVESVLQEIGADIGEASDRAIGFTPFAPATPNATGDGKAFFVVPAFLNGYLLISVDAAVGTVSSSGTVDVQLRRRRSGANVDMLTTKCTIDANEETSITGTAEAVDTSNDDLATGDIVFVDVDAVGTGSAGLTVTAVVRAP